MILLSNVVVDDHPPTLKNGAFIPQYSVACNKQVFQGILGKKIALRQVVDQRFALLIANFSRALRPKKVNNRDLPVVGHQIDPLQQVY
jgi:hypothetical protein